MSTENGFSSKDFKGHLQISHSQKCQANFTAQDRSYQTVNHGSEAEKWLTMKPKRGFLEVYKETVKKLWHFIIYFQNNQIPILRSFKVTLTLLAEYQSTC